MEDGSGTRRGRGGDGRGRGHGAGWADHHGRARRSWWVTAAVSAAAGLVVWLVWLGWDRSASYDVVTGTRQDPYVTLQVLGCALTLGVVTAVLAARRRALPAALGAGAGFWLAWTASAATQDDSGLFVVGALLLAVGLAAGLALAATSGWAVREGLRRRARRRTAAG